MPREARWFIKTSLLYLVLALLTGLALTLPVARSLAAALYPTYLHLFTVGWLTQLIFGVAFWLFPRYRRDRLFGHRWLMWTTYGLLNTGLVLRAVTEPFPETAGSHQWGLMLSALLQWLGGLLFVVYIWPRVKTK